MQCPAHMPWRVERPRGLCPRPDGAEHGAAPDCLQRPLLRRSRFRQQVSPSVDMTSDVKSWLPIVLHFLYPHGTASIGRGGASKIRRLILLISVGWLPPYLRPSGACLGLGTRVCFSLLTPSRVAPNRGCVSSDAQAKPSNHRWRLCNGLTLWSQRDLLSNGPHKRTQFPRDGDDHLVGIFPSGAELAVAFTQAYLGLPTDILDRLGHLLQA
jgi:hypothetical protein